MVFLESEPQAKVSPELFGRNGHLEGSIDLAGSRLAPRDGSWDNFQVDGKGSEDSAFAAHLKRLPDVLSHEQQVHESARIFIGQVALQRLADLAGSTLLSENQKQSVACVVETNQSRFLLKHFRLQTKNDRRRKDQPDQQRLADIAKRDARWELQMSTAAGLPQSERESYIDGIIESQKGLALLGQESFNRMVETNLRLCVHVAKIAYKKARELGRRVEFADVVGYGTEGLLIAIARYDFRKGFKFSTYASYWIRQKIDRTLNECASLIRVPKKVEVELRDAKAVEMELTQALGRLPTFKELVAEGFDPELARVNLLVQTVSLSEPAGLSGDLELGNLILDTAEQTPQEIAEFKELQDAIKKAMERLNPREDEIIRWRFGLGDTDPLTLEEAGKKVGISRERARQIEAGAFAKLRDTPALVGLRRSRR